MTGGNLCRGVRERMKVDQAYVAFYRRCVPGLQGQLQAQNYAKKAVAMQSTILVACNAPSVNDLLTSPGPGPRF
jgi:hypothetical protein